jgi:hypothetical protein
MYDAQGHFSEMIMSANRQKADTSPRIPVGQAIAFWGTYTVNEEAKTLTRTIEPCSFPQWDGGTGTVSTAFPTEDEFQFWVTKPFPDPALGGAYRTTPYFQTCSSAVSFTFNSIDPEIQGQLQALKEGTSRAGPAEEGGKKESSHLCCPRGGSIPK